MGDVTIIDDKPTGKLSIKHKAFLIAVGTLLVWIGNRFINAKTYEEVKSIVDEAEEKSNQLEAAYPDEIKQLE